jgi:hypothetical protein
MRGSHMAAWRQRPGSAIAGPRAEMDVRLIAAVGHDSAASVIRDGLPAERIATDTLVGLLGKRTIHRLGQLMKPMSMAKAWCATNWRQHQIRSFFFIDIFREHSRQALRQGPPFRPASGYTSGIPHSASALFTRKRPFCRLVNGSPVHRLCRRAVRLTQMFLRPS